MIHIYPHYPYHPFLIPKHQPFTSFFLTAKPLKIGIEYELIGLRYDQQI